MSLGNPSAPKSSPATPAKGAAKAHAEANQIGPEALKAYAHPLRMAILRYLHDHGTATSTTLAQHLGESTGQTSYHLRQLAKHGLVEDVPERGTGRERWWRSRSTNVGLDTMLTDKATAHAANVLLSEMLRERTETLGRWLATLSSFEDPARLAEDPFARNTLHSQSVLLLTAAELEELSETLADTITAFADRVRGRFDDGAPEGAVRVRAYIDVFPLPDEGPARD